MGIINGMIRIASSIIRTVGGWIKNGVRNVLSRMRSFFVKLVSWTDMAYKKFEIENGVEFDSSQFYLKQTGSGMKRQTVNYIQLPGNQWEKNTFEGTREISVNEVPADIWKKAQHNTSDNSYNITESVDNELRLVY